MDFYNFIKIGLSKCLILGGILNIRIMMSLSLDSQSDEDQQKSRNELIQLLLDEIIFLGSCYDRAKSLYQQKIIRNAGSKLQKVLNKQKKQKSLILPYLEFQKIVKEIYYIITDVVNKM